MYCVYMTHLFHTIFMKDIIVFLGKLAQEHRIVGTLYNTIKSLNSKNVIFLHLSKSMELNISVEIGSYLCLQYIQILRTVAVYDKVDYKIQILWLQILFNFFPPHFPFLHLRKVEQNDVTQACAFHLLFFQLMNFFFM